MMTRLTVLFISMALTGFILAGTYFYFLLYAGQHVTTQSVYTNRATMTTAAGLQARRDVTRYQPFSVMLSPEMNPISLSLAMERGSRTAGTARTEYRVDVSNSEGVVISSRPVSVRRSRSRSGSGSNTVTGIYHIGSFTVTESDSYLVKVTPQEHQAMRVGDLKIHVRRNTWTPNIALAISGIGLGVFGTGGGIVSVIVGSRRSSPPRSAKS